MIPCGLYHKYNGRNSPNRYILAALKDLVYHLLMQLEPKIIIIISGKI